jgi:LacI family transcriptional regulator
MINSIEIEAKRRGYFVNISLHEKDKDMEIALLQRLVDYHVDGIILSPVNAGEEFANFLNSLKTPVIVIGNEIDDSIPSVRIDEEAAAQEAVERMADKGYERIVFVCPPLEDKEKENIYSHELRKNGFLKAALKYENLQTDIIGEWNYIEAVDAYIKDKSLKTVFFLLW